MAYIHYCFRIIYVLIFCQMVGDPSTIHSLKTAGRGNSQTTAIIAAKLLETQAKNCFRIKYVIIVCPMACKFQMPLRPVLITKRSCCIAWEAAADYVPLSFRNTAVGIMYLGAFTQRSFVYPYPSVSGLAGGNSDHGPRKTRTKTQTTPDSVSRERRNSDHGLSFWGGQTQTMV